MSNHHEVAKLILTVTAYISATLTPVPMILTPAPAIASPRLEMDTQAAVDLEIDGDSVTMEPEPGEITELTFEWFGNERLRLSYRCANIDVRVIDPDGDAFFFLTCTDISEPRPTQQLTQPFDSADPGLYTLEFGGGDQTGDPFAELRLVSHLPDIVGSMGGIGASPSSVPPLPAQGAAWLSFPGVEGHDLVLEVRSSECYNRYRVRRPDNSVLAIGFPGTNPVCQETAEKLFALPLGRLPETGTYRVELTTFFSSSGTGSVHLRFGALPDTCLSSDVAPIMLVHGFNGDTADWDFFRPILVERITQELLRSGAGAQDAALCADLYVHAVALGPRDSSYANGLVLAEEIRGFLDRVGAAELDIIAHSKGGLDSRRAIHLLGAEASAVRNLAMMATPNRGTFLADVACGLHNLRPLEGPATLLLSFYIESTFGPCRGPDDALYVITEDFVLESFNQTVVDSPEVTYHTIAGDSSCPLCEVFSLLINNNDRLVPVLSAHRLLPVLPTEPNRYNNLGTFDLEHDQYQTNESVLARAYCSLVGRRPEPSYCAGALNQPQVEPSVAASASDIQQTEAAELAHVDAVEVQANDSASVTLPVGGLGNTGVAVMASSGVSATVGGVPLQAEQTEFGHTLSGLLDSPTDVDLTVSNPGSTSADVIVLLFGSAAEGLEVEITPEVTVAEEPLEIRVPALGTVTGLQGIVSDPGGDPTPLTFTMEGPDAVASFTPTTSGDYRITVLHEGERRRVASERIVVGSGAATLPGTFTESLETDSDGLATALHLDVDIEVSEPGAYRLTGGLTTAEGVEVGVGETSAELAAGQRQLRLSIPGAVLFGTGEDGPFRLQLTLLRVDPDAEVEALESQVTPASSTQPYQASDFRPATLTAGYVSIEQAGFDTAVADVPVTLSEPITRPVTVDYASLNLPGDQYAHSPEDFHPVSGSLTFLPGETTKTIPLTINGDPDQQGNKLAVIVFTNPTNATIAGNGQGGVAILAEPTATVDTPAPSFTWSAGEQVSFSGHIQDPVDGLLPASALHWRLRLQHCPAPPDPAGCHAHQLQEWHGVASGSFTAPDHGYPAHLELELTAEGPSGFTHHAVRQLHPDTVQLTIASNPPGRLVAAGFSPAIFQQRTPYTLTAIQGSTVLLGALDHQENGVNYVFQQWSHGGAATQSIQAPTVPTTYTATFVTDRVTMNPPSAAAGPHPAVAAAFGPRPPATAPARSIVLVNDGTARPTEGCNPLVGFPTGAIALVNRGTCPFTQKVRTAQAAGASAVIVINNQPGDAVRMDGTDPTITIPSVMVSLNHGTTIRTGLPATGTVTRIVPTGP